MTPLSENLLQLEEQMIPAAGNPALPPQSTTTAAALVDANPLNKQFADGSMSGYPVRGEKEWQ